MTLKIEATTRLLAARNPLATISFKFGDEKRTIKTDNFQKYDEGFSLTVATELEAFQVCYVYQHSVCKVRKTPAHGYLVQVYGNK